MTRREQHDAHYDTTSHPGATPVTHHPILPVTPQDAIAAALDDYWITSDPAGPFNTTQAAHHIDASLTGYGYTITTTPAVATATAAATVVTAPRCTCPPPSRANIALTALLALTCLTACLAAWIRGEHTWAFTALIGATALTNKAADNLRLRTRQAHR
ncbi:hypothetical protein [Streptomyces sp. NPDC101455]|uniref:hypothetical protein n=1 Tax=Streptomyces sp. NPDC101455 TaxID=3366142 RepID=UPI003811B87C